MKLQTQIPLQKQTENIIDYNSNVLLLGSCFSDNIGKKLNYFKFQNLQNPFGILFQPKAIESLIANAVEGKEYSEKDVFFHNEQWHCFDAHSKLSNASKVELLNDLNSQVKLAGKQIQKSTHIVIALGTAWVYRFIENNQVVANCHKVVQKQFSKELLSVEDILKSLQNISNLIQSANSEASIIFTVSPVRHLKDGFIENTQSKAHLIVAIHKLVPLMGPSGTYFPSYEIMMDELRDYRFYAEDMVHPNQTAINYIWNKFKGVLISSEAQKTMKRVDVIQKGIEHKPFNPNSDAHQEFLSNLKEKEKALQKEFPFMAF